MNTNQTFLKDPQSTIKHNFRMTIVVLWNKIKRFLCYQDENIKEILI